MLASGVSIDIIESDLIMEENTVQDQQIESKADVKAEQYNKPKDIRLPLPGSLQEIVGSLLRFRLMREPIMPMITAMRFFLA